MEKRREGAIWKGGKAQLKKTKFEDDRPRGGR